jgi:hypothetical protein
MEFDALDLTVLYDAAPTQGLTVLINHGVGGGATPPAAWRKSQEVSDNREAGFPLPGFQWFHASENGGIP